jgi:hypothetical protein
VRKVGIVLLVGMMTLAIPRAAFGNGGVVITEVAFKESEEKDWTEIYNAGAASIDISGYKLSDLDTTGQESVFTTSATTLDPGEYAVIHWESGTDEIDTLGDANKNGYIDLYILDVDPAGTDDQLALVNDTGAYVDAVIWSDNSGGGSSYELDDFNTLAPEQWDYLDVTSWTEYDARSWTDSDDISSGESLSRYRSGSSYADSDKKDDWYEETSTTPGSDNNQATAITLSSLTAHPTLSQATFFPWQWLALAGAVVAFGGVLWRGGCLSDREDSTRGIKSW